MTYEDDQPMLAHQQIFLLNGPPRAGKDTAAEHLARLYTAQVKKFAEPIKRAVTAIYHGGDKAEFQKYDSPELKDIPQEVYFGKSSRECQIGVSENFLKPFHNDQGVFGKILLQQILREHSATKYLYFISDSGFRREAEVLVERFGPRNVNLFRIFRDGYTFKGDSRDYITLKDLGVREFDIQNHDGNESIMFDEMHSIVDHCLLGSIK
jgi:hypothetical protein